MSYSFNYTGERAAVRRAVENDSNIPDTMKKLIVETLHERLPESFKEYNGVVVSGTGHENKNDDSYIGNLQSLLINPIKLTLAILLLALIGFNAGAKSYEPERYSSDPSVAVTALEGSISQTTLPTLPTNPQQVIPPNAPAFDTNGLDFTNVNFKVAAGYETATVGSLGYFQADVDLWSLKNFDVGLGGNAALGAYNQGLYSAAADLLLIKNLSTFQLVGKIGVGGNFEDTPGVYGEIGADINYNLTAGMGLAFLGTSGGAFTYCGAGVKAEVLKFQFKSNGSTFEKIATIYVGYAF